MSKTLYIVRRPLQDVSPSVFLPSETDGDLLLIENAVVSDVHAVGKVFSLASEESGSKVSYDEVITMLFEYEKVIVA